MTQGIRSYRDLIVWRRAIDLAEACHMVTATLPQDERFGLAQQIRRAVVAIAANIAEGHNGRSRQVFLNHLSIALGSQAELETELELAARLWKSDIAAAQQLAAEVGRLLHALRRTLESSSPTSRRLPSATSSISQ